jgi:ABC-type polysaccharide/polyol phosphate transport system ATPase subunit
VARIKITPGLGSAVEFDGAGVRLPRRQRRRGGQRRHKIRRIAGEVARDEVWFLRDASFSVAPGESLAIVGHQGSGRDQLLRLTTGTLMPDEGTVRRSMPAIPVMNLGGAFSRSYTVRQNIYLLGGLLGMQPDDISTRLPAIVERANVHKILDKFLGDTSRAVRGRLAWSIAMATEGRAFAVSNALIVGQPPFQRECWEIVEAMKASGVTFLVVSDKPSELRRFCDRALLLDAGSIVMEGSVDDALEGLRHIKPPKDQVHFVMDESDDDDDEDLV